LSTQGFAGEQNLQSEPYCQPWQPGSEAHAEQHVAASAAAILFSIFPNRHLPESGVPGQVGADESAVDATAANRRDRRMGTNSLQPFPNLKKFEKE
jgi:hypothetical protein